MAQRYAHLHGRADELCMAIAESLTGFVGTRGCLPIRMLWRVCTRLVWRCNKSSTTGIIADICKSTHHMDNAWVGRRYRPSKNEVTITKSDRHVSVTWVMQKGSRNGQGYFYTYRNEPLTVFLQIAINPLQCRHQIVQSGCS